VEIVIQKKRKTRGTQYTTTARQTSTGKRRQRQPGTAIGLTRPEREKVRGVGEAMRMPPQEGSGPTNSEVQGGTTKNWHPTRTRQGTEVLASGGGGRGGRGRAACCGAQLPQHTGGGGHRPEPPPLQQQREPRWATEAGARTREGGGTVNMLLAMGATGGLAAGYRRASGRLAALLAAVLRLLRGLHRACVPAHSSKSAQQQQPTH
jgi:hypothetical protein